MRKALVAAFAFISLLTACGVDGRPIPPTAPETQAPASGITLSGEISVGVVVE